MPWRAARWWVWEVAKEVVAVVVIVEVVEDEEGVGGRRAELGRGMAFSFILDLRTRPRERRRVCSVCHFDASGGAGRVVLVVGKVDEPGVSVAFAEIVLAGVSGRFVSTAAGVDDVLEVLVFTDLGLKTEADGFAALAGVDLA